MQDLKRLNAKLDRIPQKSAKPLAVYSLYANVKLPAAQPWLEDIRDNTSLQAFCDNLTATLKATGAQSLGAPLVNTLLQIVVVRRTNDASVLINPKVTSADTELVKRQEFCPSFPGTVVVVERPRSCTVSYMDRNGIAREELFTGDEAANVVQGVETLSGGSILDHLPVVMRSAAVRKGQVRMRKFNAMLKAARAARAGKNKGRAVQKRGAKKRSRKAFQ